METRKYPLTDEIKELTTDALDELARRLVDEAAALTKIDTPAGKLLAAWPRKEANPCRTRF